MAKMKVSTVTMMTSAVMAVRVIMVVIHEDGM